jgi:FtsP/CotA-like multicopper oxidase with cupredoxin domain
MQKGGKMSRRAMLQITRLLLLITAVTWGGGLAYAGSGFGVSTDVDGAPKTVPTYYANSPLLRKFVDGLPGVPGVTPFGANNLGQYMPAGIPEKWVNGNGVTTNDDYYEIGIVEYSERLHSDLPKATTLRGYVQLETAGLLAAGKSHHIALKYPDGTAIKNAGGNQIYAVDIPHYLGPLIIATRNTAVRVKYTNLLPKGRFNAATGQRNGDLFLPVDETLMGAGIGPDGINKYTQNGAELHLHGGDNPWISDGTPHQWTVPAGENTPWKTGASYQNVPDMPDPGAGSGTLYYPNGDSARLMFYHDHTLGLTRLNVYAGEAAGYLLTDQPGVGENALPLPSVQIPLIIQEKTFVPADIAVQDAKWDTTHWGKPGDLWFPHVYESNQDPNSWDGTSPVGRWDYGPWFWPVFDAPEALPTGEYGQVTTTPEAFGDTPLINGTAYPTLTVDPKAYRLRLLNASNDRMFNLGLYLADPAQIAADSRTNTEVKMVAATPPVPGVGLQACAANAPLNPATGLPDNCWPASWPTDGRDGGVPDPTTVGPKMIQIGTEGGLLPQAAVIPANPTNYEYFRRSVTVLNVSDHALFLGNAERADVVVDFSQYAGKTLILYNDSPAPVPAFDPRIDYYTGDPDQTDSGGWYSTLVGLGPNTRTIMQIKVTGNVGANGTPYDAAALIAALPAAFAATQPKPVVAESAFNTALGTSYKDKYARIFTGSAQQHTFDFVAGDTFSYLAEGATSMTTVSAGQTASVPVLNKAIQELFDAHGRMNATLGVEIPYTGANTQTTVPLGYIDPATETIADGETQIWKITHNGVDTHPVHFHLVNVQVINRVGWDGTVKPPNPNEVGWKETVRMNPLEDVIVAVRAKKPTLAGFGLPHSVRYLDPTQAPGAAMGFTNIDPLTGNPYPAGAGTTNVQSDFGWEYVWHCHILGHEENDFMRPFIFKVKDTSPAAPSGLTANYQPGKINLSWTDNADNEFGYRIERRAGTGSFSVLAPLLANATVYSDATVVPGTVYSYRVVAFNAVGTAASNTVSLLAQFSAQNVTLTFTPASPQTVGISQVVFNATGSGGTGNYEYKFMMKVGSVWTTVQDYSTSSSYVWASSAQPAGTYSFQVYTRNVGSSALYEAAAAVTYVINPRNAASSVTLTTNPVSPQVAGIAQVVFTAVAAGGTGGYEYKFMRKVGTTWTTVQDYSPSAAYTWSSSAEPVGTSWFQVYARIAGSSAPYEAAAAISFVINPPPVNSVTLATSLASPQTVGIQQVVFSSLASGGTGAYEYKFMQKTGAVWNTVQGYSPSSSYTWATSGLAAGSYNFQVYARNVGSTAAYEAAQATTFIINSPNAVSSVALTATPGSPQRAGIAQVAFNSVATGTTNNYEYMYMQKINGVWTTVRNYSTSPSYIWASSAQPAGTYWFQVYARNVGSAVTYEAAKAMSFTITP